MAEDKKNILIINPFGIGDVLFTTPLIRAIKTQIPHSFIGFWSNERVRPILENNPNIDKIFSLSRGDIKKIFKRSKLEGISKFLWLLRDLKKCRFDLAIDLSLDHRYSLILKFLRIRERIGYNYKSRGRFLTKRIDINGYEDKHVVEHYLNLLQILGLKLEDNHLELFLSDEDRGWAKGFLKASGVEEGDLLIGLIPGGGASWGEDASIKHWSKESFAEVADKLIEKHDAKVIILGDSREVEICQAVASLMRHTSIETSGKTTLSQFAALLSECNMVIANDGGPLHVARALGTKTISIFGPVDERVYGPYPVDQNHIVIKKDLPCRPCYKKFKLPVCERNRECINSITPGEVLQAVETLL